MVETTPPPSVVWCSPCVYFFLSNDLSDEGSDGDPANGPMMNTHSCASAWPPSKRAGPMERAGFTEVPV